MTDKTWKYGQVAIIVGTRGKEAQHMIERCKQIIGERVDFTMDSYNTRDEFTLQTVNVKAFPANNIDAVRSQPNMKFILVDEGAMFQIALERDSVVRDAIEHYIGGSDAYITFVSTAGDVPSGFFYEIENEKESLYKRLRYVEPEKYGLKKHKVAGTSIYDKKMLEKAKLLPSYNRNYLGQWASGSGEIFDTNIVNEVSSKPYTILKPGLYPSALAVDPAHGAGGGKAGSRFALLGLYKKDGIIYTSYMKEYKNISEMEGQKKIHTAMTEGYKMLLIDQSARGLIDDMKARGYRVKPMGFNKINTSDLVSVFKEDKEPVYDEKEKTVDVAARVLHEQKVRIHPTHKTLIEQLRGIKRNSKGHPDKKNMRFDVGDCFSMGVYHLSSVAVNGGFRTITC